MTTKIKRKVTVENSKELDDQPRRPSVFERLGPGAVNIAPMPADRRSRPDHEDRCRNWERTGSCSYGNTCRYKHEAFPPPNASRRPNKTEKEMDRKDLRHKVRNKRDEPKEPRMGSASPKKKGSKRSNSRSRKGEHESKIKSTVVVTRHRSPGAGNTEIADAKKKGDGNWEDDSDDWPMDAAQLDYKEELTLERKRQQLQRELELELQKERMLNENVTITKTVSFSGSSSSSSSSDSGSISSSSGSSSSSSEEDSNESTSSSSSSSSSSPSLKKKSKKSGAKAQLSKKSSKGRVKDDYDKIKSSRAGKGQKHRSPSPLFEKPGRKKGHDKRNATSVSPKRKKVEGKSESGARSNLNVKLKGPRTPSPVPVSRKQRQWDQSSSADSRSAEVQHGRNKRHKKKKDAPKSDKRKVDRGIPTPPHLSSPNRTALMPMVQTKKSKPRDESGSRRMRSHTPPMLAPRSSGNGSQPPAKQFGTNRYFTEEKTIERNRPDDRGKPYSRKEDILLSQKQRNDSRDRTDKRGRISPRKDNRKGSLSPVKNRYEVDVNPVASRKLYPHDKDKGDRHRQSPSPVRSDRRRPPGELDKKRDIRDLSPRDHDPRRDTRYQSNEAHGYEKRVTEPKIKRVVSPDVLKKGRDDRGRDYAQKDRGIDYEFNSWQGDHRKSNTAGGRRSPELRGRQEPLLPRNDRSRDGDQDRKKRKDRDVSMRSVDDAERSRLSSPRRSQSPLHGHHGVRDIETLGDSRSRIYDSDIPPGERDYAYGYDPLHEHYITDRILPSDYESDVLRGPPLYPSDVYSENRYRKDPIDRYGPRDVISPREILPHREIISLGGRSEDYLGDVPLDDRSYEERWPRGRGRDDWDPYASVPPASLPPHVAAALDEDRYGMPRRRRGSPAEWQQRNRMDDRESGGNLGHRPGRGQMTSRDGRSRSPPPPSKGQGSNRTSWNERGNRNENRNNDNRQQDDAQKNLDERKGRNVRKDRGKRKEDVPEDKPPAKEKSAPKRPHSPSPAAKVPTKKRKMEAFDILKYHGVVENPDKAKKKKEAKPESKPAANQKPVKQDQTSIDPTPAVEKGDSLLKGSNDAKSKKREDRKSRKNDDATRGDDEFSDWSDDDLDLFVDQDSNNDSNSKQKIKEDLNEDSISSGRKRDKSFTRDSSQDSRKGKESGSRTSSKDRSNEEDIHSKDAKQVVESKDLDNQESFILKEDTATDIDEYITAESVDYDPISDDELDALIEEPDDTLTPKPDDENEKSKIVDALDVDWSVLMKASAAKTGFIPGLSRSRFKAAHVLSRIGFSQTFAGAELTKKIKDFCDKQLHEEKEHEEGSEKIPVEKKFKMEHRVAAFHVSMSQNKRERINLFSEVGPYRRALCARRDLQIRKMLCRPLNKFASVPSVSYTPQYTVVDKELYKQSLEFLKVKKSPEPSPPTIACS
ncbi:zinc finger CCCH domain-containing protein 13 isoform X1 [Parasteatoda tepidariorum]|uniref:zinc finger CCCH domain-containing protein 13 isoform X1 n=1 Tax=Parasteatoda tepidariorum TaxID=114398 RepID=UPI001C722FE5|nr:zinc finger CCCH domain-containing protein 13 [Parasteatoda tepidariorum]